MAVDENDGFLLLAVFAGLPADFDAVRYGKEAITECSTPPNTARDPFHCLL
jgi:hypothetical protein